MAAEEEPGAEELEAIRRWAFAALRIPEGESWEMCVSPPLRGRLLSGPGSAVAMPSAGRRGRGFLAGLLWFCLLAWPASLLLDIPFWKVLPVLFGGSVAVGGLALWWLALWARRKETRPGQFGVGSLMFLTLFAALYLGAVRGLLTLAPDAPAGIWVFLLTALFGLLPVAVSIPFVLMMLDALLWAGVWVVRRFRGRGDQA